MLKLAEGDNLNHIHNFLEKSGAIGGRIGAYLRCYGTKMNFIYFWSQENNGEISAVISKVDGNMTVCDSDNCNFEELREFVNVIGFETLFARESALLQMGISPDKNGDILMYNAEKKNDTFIPVSENADLKLAYSLFKANVSESISDFEYLPWLSDFTYKRNRNSARVLCYEQDEKQVTFAMTSAETENNALISGVVTDINYRNKGLASKVVTALADCLLKEKKKVFVMTANDKNKVFYENNGFICVDRWGMIDRIDINVRYF